MNDLEHFERSLRRELKERSFPMGQGELDDVHALIRKHNAQVKGTRKAGWWRYGAVCAIPLVLITWWLVAEVSNKSMAPPHVPAGEGAVLPLTAEQRNASWPAQATGNGGTTGAGPVVEATGADRVLVSDAAAPKSDMDAVGGPYERTGSSASADPVPAAYVSKTSMQHRAGTGMSTNDERPVALHDADVMSTHGQRAGPLPLLMVSVPTGALEPMEPVRVPMDEDAFLGRSLGEVHAFAAPMTVNTGDAGTGPAGLFAFEYRVKRGAFSLATGVQYTTATIPFTTGQGTTEGTHIDTEYLGVPFFLGYEVGHGRVGLIVQGGVVASFFFNSTTSAAGADGPIRPDEQFNPAVLSVAVRPQVVYRMTERLGLSAGPVWSQQLTDIAHEGPLTDTRPNSFGVGAGLSWKLHRATY